MVCYARPGRRLAAIVFVAWLVFATPVSHFFNTATLMTAVTVAAAGAAVTAALVVAIFMSTRRRRAAAGGCVSCQFRCQHAMTEPARRRRLVTIADRRPPGPDAVRPTAAPGHLGAPGHRGTAPTRSVSVLLPMPTVRSDLAAPRWPDRPALRVGQQRAGSPALAIIRAWGIRMASADLTAGHSARSARTWPSPVASLLRRVPATATSSLRRGTQPTTQQDHRSRGSAAHW